MKCQVHLSEQKEDGKLQRRQAKHENCQPNRMSVWELEIESVTTFKKHQDA